MVRIAGDTVDRGGAGAGLAVPGGCALRVGRRCAVAAEAGGGTVLVSREAHRVSRIAPDGSISATWGSPGDGRGEFRDPRAVAVLADGRIVVADALNARLQLFSSAGEAVAVWGAPAGARHAGGAAGAVARALYAPAALAGLPDGGLLIASDRADGAVVRLAADGSPIDVLDGPGSPRRPAAVAASAGGVGVYAVSGLNGRAARRVGGRREPFGVAPASGPASACLPVLAGLPDGGVLLVARDRGPVASETLVRLDGAGCVVGAQTLPAGFSASGLAATGDGRAVVAGAAGGILRVKVAADGDGRGA